MRCQAGLRPEAIDLQKSNGGERSDSYRRYGVAGMLSVPHRSDPCLQELEPPCRPYTQISTRENSSVKKNVRVEGDLAGLGRFQ